MRTRKYLGVVLVLLLCMFSTNIVQAANYPYEVEVNLSKNVVTVYEKDNSGKYVVPQRAFLCSVGKSTPTGTFRISDKYQWREMFGGVYAQYATRITGHILFHSVPYLKNYAKDTLEYEEYNQLGKSVSMGCVRLTVEDAKWIYDNCPSGTTVRLVENGAVPLTPTMPLKLNPDDIKKRGWDPTDPDEKNPWKSAKTDGKEQISKERNPVSPVGKKEVVGIESDTCVGSVEVLYTQGSYYMKAEDVITIWGENGKKLNFPKVLSTNDKNKKQHNTAIVSYEENQLPVDCYIWEGVPYYRMRDLATLTHHYITWIADINKIFVLEIPTEPIYNMEQGDIKDVDGYIVDGGIL